MKNEESQEIEETGSKEERESREASRKGATGYIRRILILTFDRVDDALYFGVAALLAVSALALLVGSGVELYKTVTTGASATGIISTLDRLLLVFMIVELLYTVQISFREHALVPEPFLIVGLIAATRRVLVVTAELATIFDKGEQQRINNAMLELALLTVMVFVFVVAVLMLQKRKKAKTS